MWRDSCPPLRRPRRRTSEAEGRDPHPAAASREKRVTETGITIYSVPYSHQFMYNAHFTTTRRALQ